MLICDQWFDQWLIDMMLSDQVRVHDQIVGFN